MLRTFLRAKIRDVKLTGVNLEYEGSITMDSAYLEQADIAEFEQVHVVNRENGARLVTYVIEGARGSGIVELNGPAARLGMPGDRVMVLAYCMEDGGAAFSARPRIVSILSERSSSGEA